MNAAPLNDEQRVNTRRINQLTDLLVRRIEENPDALAAFETIRQRTVGALNNLANMTGRQAATRADIEKLIEAGVTIVVGQLRNQYRQEEFFANINEKLRNLLLTIRIIYRRITESNSTLTDSLPTTELVLKLLSSLRNQFIKFLTESDFYQAVRRRLADETTRSLQFKTALLIGFSAIMIFRFRHYFNK